MSSFSPLERMDFSKSRGSPPAKPFDHRCLSATPRKIPGAGPQCQSRLQKAKETTRSDNMVHGYVILR